AVATGGASARRRPPPRNPWISDLRLISRPGGAKECLMPGTYTQLLIHVVSSTKRRTPWITADVATRLYPYICGIVQAEKGVPYGIGGVQDHVHLYFRWRPDCSVSDLMRTIKGRSSKWIHTEFPL